MTYDASKDEGDNSLKTDVEHKGKIGEIYKTRKKLFDSVVWIIMKCTAGQKYINIKYSREGKKRGDANMSKRKSSEI